eukprot:465161-Pyramimonas_sp.AAC.1
MAQSDGAEKQDDVNGIKPERPVDLECPGASTVMPSVRSTLEWIRQQARARPSCRTQVPPRANEGTCDRLAVPGRGHLTDSPPGSAIIGCRMGGRLSLAPYYR